MIQDSKEEWGEPPENSTEDLIRDRSDSGLHYRRKISVGILGATGCVGQRFVQLLHKHPWFELKAITGSEKSVGKPYKDACNWMQPQLLPEEVGKMEVVACLPNIDCKVVFSALSSNIAGPIEKEFAENGYIVISTASAHRMDPNVPLIVPEINADHLELVKKQGFSERGMIITKPNCAVIGLSLALRPLMLEFGIEAVQVVTLQSSSGAGFPGVPSLSLLDNLLPYIAGEEEKLEQEPLKLFGELKAGVIEPCKLNISATCTRVPVTEGHFGAISIKLKNRASIEEVKRAWKDFYPPIQDLKLPSSPAKILHYFEQDDYPQPKLHRDLSGGMGVAIGRLRPCPLLDYKFSILSNNMIRGAAGGAVLIAELLVKKGHVFW